MRSPFLLALIAASLTFGFYVLGALVLGATRDLGLSRRAREDFERCRGTKHARQLRDAAAKHEGALHDLEKGKAEAEKDLSRLRDGERRDLTRTLVQHLARSQLATVPGIGVTLRDRILESCFTGTLESLTHASSVHGVGPEKATAIRSWVVRSQRDLPSLITRNFPGKAGVVQEYYTRQKQLSERSAALLEAIEREKRATQVIAEGLARLDDVGENDFRLALEGDPAAAARVNAYTVGLFPPWDRVPAWYVELVAGPEGKADGY
jgi:hypothetical protein